MSKLWKRMWVHEDINWVDVGEANEAIAEAVAREREACAYVAEKQGFIIAASLIRQRGRAKEVDATPILYAMKQVQSIFQDAINKIEKGEK